MNNNTYVPKPQSGACPRCNTPTAKTPGLDGEPYCVTCGWHGYKIIPDVRRELAS